MAGSITFTYPGDGVIPVNVRKVTLAWTCDASGVVSAAGNTDRINGLIHRVVFDPDGTDAPTDNYDVVLNDENGVDVLANAGADRDTANTEQVIPSQPIAVDGALTLGVTNAGNAKKGKVILYVR